IGRAATESDARLSALAGGCALSRELDSACLDRFLGDFGRKVFRRPLTDKEKARLRELGDREELGRAVYRRALTELLSAPQFLFHLEQGTATTPGHTGWYELSPYELASRLSYHFWQTTP